MSSQPRPTGARRPSASHGAGAGASSAGPSQPSTSRFGFRGTNPPLTSQTPLGKRTVSNTSMGNEPTTTSSGLTSGFKRTTLRDGSSGRQIRSHLQDSSSPVASPTSSSPRPPSPSASHHLSTLKTEYQSRLLLSQQSYDALESDHRKLIAENERLKSEKREFLSDFDRSQQDRAQERSRRDEELEQLRNANAELRRDALQREEDLQGLIEDADRDRQEAHSEKTRLASQLSKVESEKAHLTEQLNIATSTKAQEESSRIEAEARVEELEQQLRQSTSTAPAASEENQSLNRELHRILTHSRQVEAQLSTLKTKNAQLQKQAEGAAILREENANMKSRLASFDALQAQVVQYEDKLQREQEKSQEWDRVLSSSEVSSGKLEADAALNASDLDKPAPELPSPPNPLTRSTFPAYLSHLRGLLAGLITRTQILGPKLEQMRDSNRQLEERLQSASGQLQQNARDSAEWASREQQWIRSKSEWDEEIRRYRDLLKSYEQEAMGASGGTTSIKEDKEDVEMTDAQADSAESTSTMKTANPALMERISLLEGELRLKEAEIARLVESHKEAQTKLTTGTSAEREELQELRRGVAELQKENSSLDEQLGRAQERLGWGEFNTEKYNCLVLKRNPVDDDRDLRTKTMDRFKAENQELVKRIEELSSQLAANGGGSRQEAAENDESTAASQGLVPASTVENLRQEIKGLLDSVKVKDKAMLRLKQVYTEKASEFRSAIQSLFGFKVRFLENGQVRLNSTFSRSTSRSTSLIFQSDSDDVGRMRLAGEAASDSSLANIPHLREYWLNSRGVRQSVPCFLAALQLELYESTTQAVRGAWSVPDAEGDEGD